MKFFKIIFAFFLIILIQLCQLNVCLADEEDHAHLWEWAGIFKIDSTNERYIWSAEKVEGEYAANSMKILWLQATSGDEEGIHDLEEIAEEAFEEQTPIILHVSNGSMTADGNVYQLNFDQDSWISLFEVQFPSDSYWAAFTEHDPAEFEGSSHYFRSSDGSSINAEFETSEHDHSDEDSHDNHDDDKISKPLRVRLTVAATVVVWFCTFAGLIVLVSVKLFTAQYMNNFIFMARMFAAGALMSTAFCLILPEALHLIEERNSDIEESEVAGYWAAMVLLGFLTPIMVDIVNEVATEKIISLCSDDASIHNNTTSASERKVELVDFSKDGGDIVQPTAVSEEGKNELQKECEEVNIQNNSARNLANNEVSRVLSGVIVGDFMHNFCDGIFIGAAFKSCSVSVGWTIASATVFHELSQEIADYIALTTSAGFKPFFALTINFLSGVSVLIGGCKLLYICNQLYDKD